MSFGAAAVRRGRRPAADAACPCGGGTFGECCGPVLGGTPAATAESLMRSRYTAFACGDLAHLQATWHPSTLPADLDLDPQTVWTGLRIVAAHAGQAGQRQGTVRFRARWSTPAGSGTLEEHSRFVFQRGRWWYLDGVIAPVDGA